MSKVNIGIHIIFSNFSCRFLNPNNFSNLSSNCSNLLEMRNLQEQIKKAFCYQKLFWTVTVWINCSIDLKIFCKFSAFSLEFRKFFSNTGTFFLTVGQNNFGNKIPKLFLNLRVVKILFIRMKKDRTGLNFSGEKIPHMFPYSRVPRLVPHDLTCLINEQTLIISVKLPCLFIYWYKCSLNSKKKYIIIFLE